MARLAFGALLLLVWVVAASAHSPAVVEQAVRYHALQQAPASAINVSVADENTYHSSDQAMESNSLHKSSSVQLNELGHILSISKDNATQLNELGHILSISKDDAAQLNKLGHILSISKD
jgi:DICT domain-containing protein